jgi:hypothetical protein
MRMIKVIVDELKKNERDTEIENVAILNIIKFPIK